MCTFHSSLAHVLPSSTLFHHSMSPPTYSPYIRPLPSLTALTYSSPSPSSHLQAFQKQLGARNSSLNSVLKAGKLLLKQKEGEDAETLQAKLDKAQQMWDSVCQKSVDRQQKLQVRSQRRKVRVQGAKVTVSEMQRCAEAHSVCT